MEIENGAVREGVLVPVLPGSKNFDKSIRPPLQNSYMYKESKQSFRYNSAFLINNDTLQERYEAFRTKRRDMGYSEEELEESYGFLLFDDENKANKVGETGVVPGHSTCSTLGDPSKGVYVSKYSDCLDLNRWYHGKSGYIAIIRLTKGRVREVTENYTVNYTSPSNGFDCHVSEHLSAVSANTSSFLAFERTQYYMYELPVGGEVQPPSHVCPFAIVAFSYWDTKTPASEEQEKSEEEKPVFHYYPWRGQLQISSQIYHVGLKSSTGPLIPAKLPTMMAVDRAIQMSDLRQKLPKGIFETCFSGEVSLEGMGCSLYELVPSEAEDASLSLVTRELKEKDLALTIQLNDRGFLILLHSSHFLTYEDAGSKKPEVLQGMFVFPDSRAIHRDTKVCCKKPFLSPECLQVVPALNYAETEVEKCLPSQSGELRGLLEQHIQSYVSLIHPGLTISPSREASIFPDQFDVPDALKYLYSAPKWTEMGWKRLKSYFHQPGSFELSVSRATELLVAGREERGDEPDDDVYYCLSSPEGPPMSPASLGGPEEQQSGGASPGDTADTAADFSKAPAVSTEAFEKPGKTMEDSNAPDKGADEGKNLQESLPSDLTKPVIPAEDFGKPGLNKADSNAPGTTLLPKEVQEEVQKELPSDLSQPAVSADDTGKTKADCNAPGAGTEGEGTSLNPEEVQVEVQEKVPSDLSQPAVSAEDLRKADLAALGKADCDAPEVGVANEETNLHPKEVQKDMPSGVSQSPVSAEVLRKPGPALTTKPNSNTPEAGVEENVRTLPQKEGQEEFPSDLSQLAVSAKAFGIASMRVMTKATEVTGGSTSPASGDLPTLLVITATEGTATVLPHNENLDLINTESTTNNSSSALNAERGKANQPSKPPEVSNFPISDWRKRPRKRHRFSGLGKRVLRSTVADFEEKEKEDKERMDVTQDHPLKMPRELMNLIQDPPLKKKERMDVTQVHPLKMPRELINLIQDPPLKNKERMDVTQVHPLKMQRELINLIQDPPLKMKSKDLIHYHPLRNKESMDLIDDDHPLKKKTERWDLKAIISECGRIFVPHGSEVIAKDIDSLKVKGKVLDHKQCADEMMVEACIKVPQPIETGDGPSLELNKSDKSKDLPIGMLDSKDSLPEVKMADLGKMASRNPSELVPNKDTDSPSSGKHKKKRQYVAISLSQLKTVLSRGGKRKKPINPVSEDQTSPLKKKSKADTGMDETETFNLSNINKASPDRTTGAVEVAKEQTFGLDQKFALALGLTPTELHNNAHKSPEKSDIPLKEDIQSRLGLVPPQATSGQTSEALPSSPSTTIPLTGQMRPFKKKHMLADSMRKKWWLHYQTPASLESEKVAISSQLLTLDPDVRRVDPDVRRVDPDVRRVDPDVRRVVSRGRPRKGASAASYTPADSLTLLADLALSTSNDKVLEQQSKDPKALEKQDGRPSLVISDNSVKDGVSPHEPDGEPEFVLHALLKHPSAARLKLPSQSPSPKGLVVGSGERVVLVSQEHSYSLPPSSLLLGLSGSSLEVPISEGLQQHRKDISADGTQALRAYLCQQQDQNRKEPGLTPESLSKGIGCRQKFHRFRRFIEKDGSVQVTRLWMENYDFSSDSKFTNDPKDKTVTRALHGPWDFDIKDTKEQVQLIIHMWIGLFYSRSTARFCRADSSLTCLEEKDSTEVAHGMVPAQVPPETKTSSPAYIALSRIPEPTVLDLSNMGKKETQPLSLEPEVLDLSMKTTSTVLDSLDTESKQRIELNNPPVYLPATGLHKETISFPKRSTGVELKVYRDCVELDDDDDDDDEDYETNNHENDSKGTLQNGVSPYRTTLESDGSYILLCEQTASVYIHQEKVLETQRIAEVLDGKDKKEEVTGDGEQNAAGLKTMGSKDVNKVQQLKDNDLVKTMPYTEVQMDGDAANMADTVERNANEPRDGAHVAICDGSESKAEMRKVDHNVKDSVEAAKPEAVHVGKDTTNKEIAKAQTAVHVGKDFTDNDKALKAVYSENVPRDDGNTKDQVQTAMQDGNDTRDEALPAVNCGEDSGDKARAVVCDGNTSVAEAPPEISHTENYSQKATLTVVHGGNDPRATTLPVKCNGKLYIDEEPTVVHDINGFTDEALPMEQGGDVSVGTTRELPEMHREIKCKDELLPTQVFPVCDGNIPFVGEFDTLIQSNNVLGEAKRKINEADVNVETKDQEKESMQGQSSTTFPPGSQHSQDETSEILTGQVEIPPIPREDIAHTEVLHSIGEASEIERGQVEMPFIGVEKDSKDITHTEVHDTHPSQNETLITVCDRANVLSGEMLTKLVPKGTESVSRCPTPTVDEVLDGYTPIPDICSGSLAICDAYGDSKRLSTGEGHSRCPTPTEDETPFVPGFSYDHNTPKTVLLPNVTDTNTPNLDSGLALIENEKAHHEPHEPSLYKARAATRLHELRKSSNNNKPNNLEAIDNQFSQVLADPRKKPIATSTPLNTPSTSFKERSNYDPYSNVRLTAVEPDLYAHSRSYSSPINQCSLTEKAAFSVPSIHPEVLSNETTEITLTGDFSEIALERETCLSPASSELILQSTCRSIPVASGPTAASQNLSVHSFTQPQPQSQQPAMAVNLWKSEDSRGQYNWEEGQTDIDPMSSDVLESKQTDTPVCSNTNAHPYNTLYATEMRQIAILQDYEDVVADDVVGENEAPSVDQDNIESSLETNWISDDQHLRSKSRLNKTKLDFINSLRQSQEWEKSEFDEVLDFSKQGTSSSVTFQSGESDKRLCRMEKNQQEWLKYCRAKRSGSQMDMTEEEDTSVAKPSLVTILDHKGNRITYENYPVLKTTASMHTRTVPDSNRRGSSSFLEFSKRWDGTHNADESDLTQSSMDLETLIFSEKMNQILKRKRKSSSSRYNRSRHRRSNVEERASTCSPAVTVRFSSLQEDQDGSEEHWEAIPSLSGQNIRVEMPERMAMPEETDKEHQHLKKLSYTKGSEMTHVKVSDLVVDSFKAYNAMMTEVCAGRKYPSRTERLKREEAKRNSSPKSRPPGKDKDFSGQMKEDMYDSLHDNLNSVVRQSCKNKFRFYILVTSSDPFFRETKELLEAEGHIAVEQSQFCLGKDSPSCPLHIILRNEDIAEHICEVPHLLELKKSQNVLFAGIDRPDDIVNLTHQELFSKGGFVVFEGAALDTLSLSNIKKMSGFLEGLSKKGKWKWLLHYRDSRKLKENARSSAEAQGKKIFMDICQEAGMVEVLPYHECDVISRERPNYLHCLVRLQVQNVSARLPVFITDTTADKAFAKHGIFTMNINSFLLISQSDTCTIS
ncbi:uncharacterized protein LOC121531610 isoform X1 [Coregonus clupeaformis]|uniref:uncharacterized protein LOC121531610 isoform X1 n=1 Tax=Coregonus clupeaformis TaxID=59861 RepID=UPI001E1C3A88|nr:uncharacterized protein LOC121531610 isoform X1 [Coregonus clupeaformis]